MRRKLRRFSAVLVLGALAGLLVASVLAATQTQRHELDSAERARDSALAQILTDQRTIAELTARIDQLRADADANGEKIAALEAEVTALSRQVRQLGGEPVVVISPSTTGTTSAATPTTTTTQPSRCLPAVALCLKE